MHPIKYGDSGWIAAIIPPLPTLLPLPFPTSGEFPLFAVDLREILLDFVYDRLIHFHMEGSRWVGGRVEPPHPSTDMCTFVNMRVAFHKCLAETVSVNLASSRRLGVEGRGPGG